MPLCRSVDGSRSGSLLAAASDAAAAVLCLWLTIVLAVAMRAGSTTGETPLLISIHSPVVRPFGELYSFALRLTRLSCREGHTLCSQAPALWTAFLPQAWQCRGKISQPCDRMIGISKGVASAPWP